MDTITHALSGALLARALSTSRTKVEHTPLTARQQRFWGPRIPVWQAVVVGLVAATFPDSDAVLQFVSEIVYLRNHRGVTHSLLMLPLWALLLGWLFSLMFRRRDAWKRYAWLSAAAIAFHIAGDWITQFGTMLLEPFSDHRFGLGSTFIIDLVLSGIIVVGLIASAVLPRTRLPAVLALIALPVWVGVCLMGRHEALAFATAYAQQKGIKAELIDAAPRPASPFNWTVVIFDGAVYHLAHVNTRRADPVIVSADSNFIQRFSAPYQPLSLARWETLPKYGALETEALAKMSWEQPSFTFYRWFAAFPQVERIDINPAHSCVWWRDLRFAFPGRGDIPFRYGMCRHGTGSVWQLISGEAAAAVR